MTTKRAAGARAELGRVGDVLRKLDLGARVNEPLIAALVAHKGGWTELDLSRNMLGQRRDVAILALSKSGVAPDRYLLSTIYHLLLRRDVKKKQQTSPVSQET